MAIEVRIPTILRTHTGGSKTVEGSGDTLGAGPWAGRPLVIRNPGRRTGVAVLKNWARRADSFHDLF